MSLDSHTGKLSLYI